VEPSLNPKSVPKTVKNRLGTVKFRVKILNCLFYFVYNNSVIIALKFTKSFELPGKGSNQFAGLLFIIQGYVE